MGTAEAAGVDVNEPDLRTVGGIVLDDVPRGCADDDDISGGIDRDGLRVLREAGLRGGMLGSPELGAVRRKPYRLDHVIDEEWGQSLATGDINGVLGIGRDGVRPEPKTLKVALHGPVGCELGRGFGGGEC